MPRISDLPAFDAADYLDTPEACAEYLTAVLEDGTDGEIRRALEAVARAVGPRDRSLRGSDPTIAATGGSTEFATVVRMMKSWGLGLSAAPLTPAE